MSLQETSMLKALVNALPGMAWVTNAVGELVGVNAEFEKFFGNSDHGAKLSLEQVMLCCRHDADIIAAYPIHKKKEWVSSLQNGNTALLEITKIPIVLPELEETHLLGMACDITHHAYIESELRLSRQLLDMTAQRLPGIIFCYRYISGHAGHFAYISDSVTAMYGLSPASLREDASPLFAFIHPDDKSNVIESMEHAAIRSIPWRRQYRTVMPDQSVKWHLGEAQPEQQEDGSLLWHGVITDISEKIFAEETLRHQSNHDILTDLPNRQLFCDSLTQIIWKASCSRSSLALVVMNLDRFQEVNDSLGHETGDGVLRTFAARLRQCVRQNDIVARLGGDEFVVLLSNLNEQLGIDASIAEILRRLADPFVVTDAEAYVTASMGVAVYPEDAHTADDLLKNATQAMFMAKQSGGNRHRFFTQSMKRTAQIRTRLMHELRSSVSTYPFILHYQPIIDLQHNRIHKAEALIRWSHSNNEIIPPSDFIPIAEETKLINPIGDWVYYEVVKQALKWRTLLHPQFQVSFNISPVQFHADNPILERWIDHASMHQLPGDALVLEITEGLLLDASERVASHIASFQKSGMQIALDDFGTGYSSLSYLTKFNIDYIKIDRTFVQNLSHQTNGMALCEAIIVMAHKLGIKVIAEGVENEEQRRLLKEAGCDYAQGYLFSSPLLSAQFEAFIKSFAALPAPQ